MTFCLYQVNKGRRMSLLNGSVHEIPGDLGLRLNRLIQNEHN